MTNSSMRAIVVASLLSSAVVACGGTIAPSPEGSGSGGSSVDKSSGGGSSGSSGSGGSSSSGGGSSSGNANVCAETDLSNFDTSCNVDSDCIEITADYLCNDLSCLCGGSTINVKDQTRYDDIIASVPPDSESECACPVEGIPRCVQNTCTMCPQFPSNGNAPPGCPVPDAG